MSDRPRHRIVPFADEHLTPAAALLAIRQARWRTFEPDLSARYEDPATVRPLLAEALAADGAGAVAAIDDGGRLAGFMVGAPRLEEIWGRSAWVGLVHQALATDADPDLTRDLYAAWADPFVMRGIPGHYALVPDAFAETVDAWVRLGFGKMQVHAIRSADPGELPTAAPGVRITRPGPADLDAVMTLGTLISDALLEAPTFAITLPERRARYRADYLEELEASEGDLWLATDEATGVPLAMAGFYAAEPGPGVPDDAVELGIAMTAVEARGRGVMAALVGHGLAVAAEAGARHCVTDWRVANLTASRAWPALGFRPLYWRMHRMIDERIVWSRAALRG